MSKILGKVILRYLKHFCEGENIISQNKMVLPKPPVRLQSHITKNMSINTLTTNMSIDCTKAFDSVSHDMILNKHKACAIAMSNCCCWSKVLHSYLRDLFCKGGPTPVMGLTPSHFLHACSPLCVNRPYNR